MGAKRCETLAEYACVNKTLYDKYLSVNFIKAVCLPDCPLECKRMDYKTSLSSSKLIGDIYVDYIKGNPSLSKDFVTRPINADAVRECMIILNVFYDSLSYKLSTESAQMDIVTLLSSIGGTMGLFMGVSIFSLFELVEVFIEIYFILNLKNRDHF